MEQFDLYKEHGTLDNASLAEKLAQSDFKNSMCLILNTEFVKCEYFNGLEDVDHLLDIRIFRDDCEFRAVRSDMSKLFQYRILDDEDLKSKKNASELYYAFDEKQYLDIDLSKSNGYDYVTTGGGKYTLPIENAERIQLRNYGVYNQDGELQIKDFRIVKLLAKGEK